jgi:hypothetical protein
MSPTLRNITLLTVCLILLGACAQNPFNRTPTATTDTKAGDPSQQAPIVPTAIEAQPAPAATPVPAPAAGQVAAPGAALVGPEWTILASGDLNGDSAGDVVGVKLIPNLTGDATFKQPQYAAYKGPASEVVIVQAGADGKPQIQAIVTGGGLSVAGTTLATFAGAAGYMVSITPGNRPVLSIQAITAAGAPSGRPIGLEWTGSGYALFGRGK